MKSNQPIIGFWIWVLHQKCSIFRHGFLLLHFFEQFVNRDVVSLLRMKHVLNVIRQPWARRCCVIPRVQHGWCQKAVCAMSCPQIIQLTNLRDWTLRALGRVTQVRHQLWLEVRLSVLALRVDIAKVSLQVALNLVLQKWRITFFRFRLLIQQKFRQKNSVLSLVLLQLLVQILVLLYLIVEHRRHLVEL